MDIWDRIDALLRERKISSYKLSKDTGISTGLITQWRKRMQNPSREKLQIISEYFEVSIDSLLSNEPKIDPVQKDEVTFDDFTYALHNESKDLTEENKEKLLEMAKLFKLKQDNEKK